MKKLLLSTLVLLSFSISIILFQLSCKKSADAQSPSFVLSPATTAKLGGVIPDGSTISVDANGKISAISNSVQENKLLFVKIFIAGNGNANKFDSGEIWTANYDGSNQQKLNVTLPNGIVISTNGIKLSPDHKTIFFGAYSPGVANPNLGSIESIYSCNIDGSNGHQIINGGTAIAETSVAY